MKADRWLPDVLAKKMNGVIQPAIDYWARNEVRARTKEGEDEKFVIWAKKLLAATREDELVHQGQVAMGAEGVMLLDTNHQTMLVEVKREAKLANAGFSPLFYCSDVEELLRLFLTFGNHFRKKAVFRGGFLKSLIERHGGVSALQS